MNRFIGALLVGSMIFSAGSAFASGFGRREARQQARIQQGVRSGALTPREAARIERHETRLDREARRDGVRSHRLSYAERVRLERQQRRLSRRIWMAKHNRNRS